MADEFSASLDLETRPSLEMIVSDIEARGHYLCERKSTGEATFRFSDRARQIDWPEDFTLAYIGPNLMLTVYGATRQQRSKIIRDIEALFDARNAHITFQAL